MGKQRVGDRGIVRGDEGYGGMREGNNGKVPGMEALRRDFFCHVCQSPIKKE